MSNLSPSYPSTNLYCDEAINDASSTSTDDVISNFDFYSTNPAFAIEDGESSSIINMFNSELDQVPMFELLQPSQYFSEVAADRCDAIKWMFKVKEHYNFRAHTAYLSVKYLDRFHLSHAPKNRKRWAWQLLSVACLSLAAKMEETKVPSLLELQMLMVPDCCRLMFKPTTVQRMELLVMSTLNWRMHIITPFNFLHYFIAKFQCFDDHFRHQSIQISSHASDLILSSCTVEFMDYTPSTIAAAAALCVSGLKINDEESPNIHGRLNNEMVKKCRGLFDQHLIKVHPPKFD